MNSDFLFPFTDIDLTSYLPTLAGNTKKKLEFQRGKSELTNYIWFITALSYLMSYLIHVK